MGCVCCSLSSFVSIVLHALERSLYDYVSDIANREIGEIVALEGTKNNNMLADIEIRDMKQFINPIENRLNARLIMMISLCTVCALLSCCLLFTMLTVMIMGIGIGYHYCFVSNSVDAMAKAAKSAGALRSGGESASGPVMRSLDRAVKRGFAHRLSRRETNDTEVSNRNSNITDVSNLNTTTLNVERTPNVTSA